MVSLTKGQTVNLTKNGGAGLNRVVMGLGWDVAMKKGLFGTRPGPPVDLDASCAMFDRQGELIDTIWFGQLKSRDGSVVHTGDNRTGDGDGDDEQILVDLNQLPASVSTLVFTVNSFTGITFEKIENATCRIVDQDNNEELARYELSGSGSHTAQIMAKISRASGAWQMTAIGERTSGRTMHDLMPAIRARL